VSTPRLWCFDYDYDVEAAMSRAQDRGQFDLLNDRQVTTAEMAFYRSLPGRWPWPDPFPADFPHPRFRIADPAATGDFFKWGTYRIVSRRLRAAMALPEWAVHYVPVDLDDSCRAAHEKDYAWMQTLAFAEAVDYRHSPGCKWSTAISAKTGEPYISISWLDRIRFMPGLHVPADLFNDVNASAEYFATDALAERVLAAGCTGVWFVHPLWRAEGDGSYVIRTAEGMGRVLWDDAGQDYEIVPFDSAEADAGPRTEVYLSYG
jgi:hypothetical protein